MSEIRENNENMLYEMNPKRDKKLDEPILSEKKLALFGATAASFIIAAKLYYQNENYLRQLIFETKLVSYKEIVTDGEVMMSYAWKVSARYSQFWLPLLCGLFITYFTGLIVYLDSKEPGIQPPSPFAKGKQKSGMSRAGPIFHLNYVFAILMGILVTFYGFYKGVSLEYQ